MAETVGLSSSPCLKDEASRYPACTRIDWASAIDWDVE
jgi:hypothetical protein